MTDRSHSLSPLDQIRLVESEITRQLTSARVSADERVMQARLQAEQDKKAAFDQGRSEGQNLKKEIIAQAEEEARSIRIQGNQKSAELNRKGRQQMKEAVRFTVGFIMGTPEQESKP